MDKKQKRTCVEDSSWIGHPEFRTNALPPLTYSGHPLITYNIVKKGHSYAKMATVLGKSLMQYR